MNITPDHLDRYDHDFQNYIDSKFRITRNQTKSDFLVYWAGDPVISAELKKRHYGMTLLPFSDEVKENMAAYTDDNDLILDYINKKTL